MSDEREYRDHALSRVYREGAWPEPGRQIDQAILAASRRAARERSFVRRWAPSFAVAATVVLTSTLVLKAYREQPDVVSPSAPAAAPEMRAKSAPEPKAAEAKPAAPPAPAAVPTPQGFSSTMDAAEAARLERAQRDIGFKDVAPAGAQKAAPGAKAPPALKKEMAVPAPAADSLERRADVPQPQRAAPAQAPAPVSVFGAPPPAAAAARATSKPTSPFTQAPAAQTAPPNETTQSEAQAPAEAKTAPPAASAGVARNVLGGASVAGSVSAKAAERTPQSWIEDIRKLMKEGRSEEAGEQIAEFKKRYPDFALPEDLR